MAFNFTSENPVLNFGPRSPREHGKRISWEYILWPAWAYRVVAPCVRARQLNMFQRAVLGLCRAGLQGFEAIGEKLAIHSDLATFILIELTDLGYVDRYGLPNERGLRVLADDASDAHDIVAGYVFQDPWTGELWPRFMEHLDYCDLEYEESGFPKLILGSKGKPWRQGAFMVSPGESPDVSTPTAANVVAAVSGHRKGMRYAEELTGWDDDLDQPRGAPSAVHINRVSFVEEEPSPVYLMTYLYLTDGFAGNTDWYACDPFGLGASLRLRGRVEQVMQTMQPLYAVVNRLVGRGVHEGLEEQRRWVEHLRTKATLEVEQRLTVNIRGHAAFDQIVYMEFARQEASQLGREGPEWKLRGALRACREALEALFGALTSSYPLGDVWKRVYVPRTDRRTGARYLKQQLDSAWLAATYRAAALGVGFEEPIPESLLNIRAGQIRSVVAYADNWRLLPLVTATIMAAQLDPDHPLRRAAKLEPRLLQDVDEVAKRGGKAGHANKAWQADDDAVTLDDLERTVERTYGVISVLSGLGTWSEQATKIESGAI